ncbi:MAG: hypothetical protein WC676_07620 [Candidatus Omnitrophota bacterium]
MSRLSLRDCARFLLPFGLCFLVVAPVYPLTSFLSRIILNQVNVSAGKTLQVSGLIFSRPGKMILQEVFLEFPENRIFLADRGFVYYALSDLWKGDLVIRKAVMKNGHIDRWKKEIVQNIQQSLIAKQGIHQKRDEKVFDVPEYQNICFQNFAVKLPDLPGSKDAGILLLDFCLTASNSYGKCQGQVRYRGPIAEKSFAQKIFIQGVNFLADVEFLSGDLLINHADFSYKQFVFRGTGMIRDLAYQPNISIKFHSDPVRLDQMANLKQLSPQGGEISLTGELIGNLERIDFQSELSMPSVELNIDKDLLKLDNLTGRFRYQLPGNTLVVEQLSGIVDDETQFNLRGNVINIFSPRLDLRCDIFQRPDKRERSRKAKLILAAFFKGRWGKDGFLGQVDIVHDYSKDKQYRCRMKDLLFFPGRSSKSWDVKTHGVFFEELKREEKSSKVVQGFEFKTADLKFHTKGKTTWLDDFSMPGYGGVVLAKGAINFRNGLSRYFLQLNFENLDLKNVKLFDPLTCDISGIVSGSIEIKNQDVSVLRGTIAAQNFSLKNFAPLDKVSEFIGIDSLREVQGKNVIIDFELTDQKTLISRLDLDGDHVQLRSRFDVDQRPWLDGVVALSLPRASLEQSKIFKTLLSIARERDQLLDFVVHVSGFSTSLRTELIESNFRDKLKEQIGVKVQRYIEQKVNQAVEGP